MYAINYQAITSTLNNTASPSLNLKLDPSSPQYAQHVSRQGMQLLVKDLMVEVAKRKGKDSSLPPNFIVGFLNRVFPLELENVDFPQALTALDYLKDLESRRRKEQSNALRTLGVDQSVLNKAENSEELAKWFPDATVAAYVRSLPRRERRADILYTQLYIALRRWVSFGLQFP
jgi:hypothetical protein